MLAKYLALPTTVHILCIGTLINRAGTFLIPFLTIYLRDHLQWDDHFVTLAPGIFGLGALTALFLGGQLADLWGRKRVMVGALAGAAALLLAFSEASAPWSVLTLLFCFSLVGEMYRPAASAMIADVTPMAQRPHAFALMYVAINLGFAIATPLGGQISEWSFLWLFRLDAVTCAIYAGIIGVALTETLRRSVGTLPAGEADEGHIRLAAALRHMSRDRTFILYCLGTFFLCLLYMQAMSILPLHLDDQGFTTREYGWIIGVNGMMIVALQLPVTSWVSRFSRRIMLPISSLVTGAGFALTGVMDSGLGHATAVVVWTCGEMINAPLISAIIGDLAPANLRARYMGVFAMCFPLAMIVSPIAGGFVLRTYGAGVLYTICAVVGLASAGLYVLAGRGR